MNLLAVQLFQDGRGKKDEGQNRHHSEQYLHLPISNQLGVGALYNSVGEKVAQAMTARETEGSPPALFYSITFECSLLNMKIKQSGLVLPTLMLLACSSGQMHTVKMDDTLNSYGGAIRFREFGRAADFQNPARQTPLDNAWLKNIHVSSYDSVHRKMAESNDIVEQTVEIRYFNELVGVEKSLTDHQVWRYYKDKDKWMLETDLPAFK